MHKILKNNKLYKILIGVMVFLCAGFIFNNDAIAALFSKATAFKYYPDTKKFGVTVSFTAGDEFTAVDVACKHSDGTQKYVGNILPAQYVGTHSANLSWDVSGWKVGTWNCWVYSKNGMLSSRVDFSIWKSTFPTCDSVNSFKDTDTNKEAHCSKKPDDGNVCSWSNGKCVNKKDQTPQTPQTVTARGGYYYCGGACKYYSEGSKLGTDCGTSSYGAKTTCENANNRGTQTPSTETQTPSTGTQTPSTNTNPCASGQYYDKNTNNCYVLDEINCKHFGFSWENGSCNQNKQQNETWCSGDNQYLYNGNCYVLDAYNCTALKLCGVDKRCEKHCSSGNGANTNPKITFDKNYGINFACDAGFVPDGDSKCSKTGKIGDAISFPNVSSVMSRDGKSLIGWTKVVDNGTPDCTQKSIEKDLGSKITLSSNVYYYACYEEYIHGYRSVITGYDVNGGTTYNCGDSVWINYCTIEDGVGYCYDTNNTKIYRDKLNSLEASLAYCNGETQNVGERFVLNNGNNYSCGDKLYITSCDDDNCYYSKIISSTGKEIIDDGEINKSLITTDENNAKKECSNLDNEFNKLKKCNGNYTNKSITDKTGTKTYQLCYLEKNIGEDYNYSILKEISKYYTCSKGYSITEVKNLDENMTCNDNGVCVNNISVTCSKSKNETKPNISVTSGIAQNGKGVISVKAAAKEGRIVSYYVSEYYKTPTNNSRGWIDVNSDKFTIEHTPGVLYIWVRDNKGVISNAVTGAVIDTVNTNTTISELELFDSNGNLKTPVSSISYKDTIKSSKYVLMNNDLGKDSEVLADGFNPFDMEYKLDVESPTLAVYATLTSTDSNYVPGYEPRTVNLDYGINTILIKIKNKEGIIRTYTILATRVDDRTSDNTLSDLSVSEGNINFNANVTDYKVEISKNAKTVNVEAKIGSDKASYVNGYEPGSVTITGDTTVKLIKVKSETGSTRTYVITFVKKGTDIIEKESLQLADLVISDVNLPFEKKVSNYSLSVGYETDVIDITTTKMDKDSIVSISVKRKSENSYSLSSGTGIALDVGENFIELKVVDKDNEISYYRITIIRKEFGLDISNDTSLKDLKVLGYDIDFEPSKKEYTVRIKQEKTLVITAVPLSNRAEVFIRGNDELTGFSTVRVKVVAENGEYETYSIDIKKDAFNKTIEIAAIVAGVVIILVGSSILIVKKKNKARKEYFEE